MAVDDLIAAVVIGGVIQTSKMSVRRVVSLTRISCQFTVTLADHGTPTAAMPGQSVLINEAGLLVLTGSVDSVHYVRSPEPTIVIEGRDNFKLAEDYFLDDPQVLTDGESVAYWVDYICGQCGLSYSFADVGSSMLVGENVPIALVTAAEALRSLCSGPGYQMRMTAGGVLEFFLMPLTGDADEVITDITAGGRMLGDAWTRNVAKVWGATDEFGQKLLYQETRAIPGITPDRIMLVASLNITSEAGAAAMAASLLDHFASIDQISEFIALGSNVRRIGQMIEATAEPGHTHRAPLSDLESVTDVGGYSQGITIGRKNWLQPSGPPAPTVYPEWSETSVYGEARDCNIHGDSIYSAGYTWIDNIPTGSSQRVWRVERRLLYGGGLVWGVNINLSTVPGTHNGHNGGGVTGIQATNDGVFVIGTYYYWDGLILSPRDHIACLTIGAGAVTWETDLDGSGNIGALDDLVVNETTVWAMVIGFVQVGDPESYHITLGTCFYPLDPLTGTLGTPVVPATEDPYTQVAPLVGVFDDPGETSVLLTQLYLGADGGFLSGGMYRKIIGRSSFHAIAPNYDITYSYRSLSYFAYYDSAGGLVWETRQDYVPGTTGTGNIASIAIDGAHDKQFRLGSDDYITPPWGGLARNTEDVNDWKVNIGFTNSIGHIEIGNYCYVSRDAQLQWYATGTGAYVSQRTLTDTFMRGVQLYNSALMVGVCGQSTGLFWTAFWNQPS